VHGIFSNNYKSTIGVDFALKVLEWDDNTVVRLQLWDIAGQERFGNMTRVYYKEACGAIVVFDVTTPKSFEAVERWKNDIDEKVMLSDGGRIPVVLLANKCDLLEDESSFHLSSEEMDQFCADHGFHSWFFTSAKEDTRIGEATQSLVTVILDNDAKNKNQVGQAAADSVTVEEGQAQGGESAKKGCC